MTALPKASGSVVPGDPPSAGPSADGAIDHLGVVAAAEHPRLAAHVVRGRRQVLDLRPVAVAGRESGGGHGPGEARGAAAGSGAAVDDDRILAAAEQRGAEAAADDVAA